MYCPRESRREVRRYRDGNKRSTLSNVLISSGQEDHAEHSQQLGDQAEATCRNEGNLTRQSD